jgi:hypothetical protein
LWKYCISTSQWVIVKSDSVLNGVPVWGTKGVSSASTIPPYLFGSIAWTDNSGHLYMFGGWWVGNVWSNTLWMYTIDPACAPCSNGIPVINFSASDTAICPGTCIDIINTSQMYSSFQWTFPGGTPVVSTLVNPQNICYSTSGTYDITLIATGASTDTLTYTSYITVLPAPSPQGVIQSGDTLFAIGGSASYQWYFNNIIINGASDYFYVAPQSGNYNVIVTDSNGCEVEAVINNVIASLNQFPVPGSQLGIFPNPVTDQLTIQKLEFKSESAVEVSVYNVLGEKIDLTFYLESLTVECRILPSGLYYLEITTGKKTYRTKFLKQ